jgi:116 kDa U5 small nuclear ribonucleoprotein component
MASFDDYDEFGNYIGADLDSDDEDEIQQTGFGREAEAEPQVAPLEGYEDEPMPGHDENALMEIDGSCLALFILRTLVQQTIQNLFIML